MNQTSSAPGGEARLALTAGIGCYVIWGFVPLLFQALVREGATPLEILAQRCLWGLPIAALFVAVARQGAALAAIFRQPKVLAFLALSAALIAFNWTLYMWAVTSGRMLEGSLGYYINPLINMAVGALLFRERIDRVGAAAIALAALGVAIQTLALGRLPLVSVALALSFAAYGVVRKQVAADAQSGFFVECLLLAAPGLAYVVWLERAGLGHAFDSPATTGLFIFAGAATAVPLILFAWAARRVPFSVMGFLQFSAPTIVFVMGMAQGEPLTPLRALSFGFIWAGAATFIYGAWRRARLTAVQIAAQT